MALSVSRRLLRSFGSALASGHCDSPSSLYPSFPASLGLCQDPVIPVTNFHDEDKGFTILPGDVFDVPVREDIVHRVVLWQLAKWQQGTRSTKLLVRLVGLEESHGIRRVLVEQGRDHCVAPQFRGGSTMHGPKPRGRAFKLTKKVRRLGLKLALTARTAEGKGLNFYSIMHHDMLVMPRAAVNEIVQRMHTPIKR